MIEQLIKELSEDLGIIAPSEKNENGYFPLELSDSMTISIKENSPGLLLQAEIALIPPQTRESLLEYFSEANFLGQGTGQHVIGIDPEEKFLTLSHSIPYDVDYQKFKEILEDFANHLNHWQKEAERLQKDATEGIV